MTQTTPPPNEDQVRAVGALGRLGYVNWSHERTREYAANLAEFPAGVIAEAIRDVVRGWKSLQAPNVHYLYDECVDILAVRRAEARDRVTGVGQGCPHCRREGIRAEWVNGSDTLAYCPTHNTAWRGQVDEQRNPLGDQPLPDDIWMGKALNGDLGRVIQNVARRRNNRETPAADPQPTALRDAMRELAHG